MVRVTSPIVQNPVDLEFSILLHEIVNNGTEVNSRNATTKRIMNQSIRFTKTPLVTIRRTAWKNALREFEWFMSGSNHIQDLHPSVHSWWKPWALKKDTAYHYKGRIPNNYSKQFRDFQGRADHAYDKQRIDQIQYMIDTLKNDPNSRRNVITTWNTADMVNPITPITNCHGTVIQAFVDPDDSIHLTMYQRSCDMMLGVPHNWIQYWAFLMYLAHKSGKKVGSFNWIGGDCHIYPDHMEMAKKIDDEVRKEAYDIPELIYTPTSDEFKAVDFTLSCAYKPIIEESLKMTV